MHVKGIVAAVLFASLPFAWSCAQPNSITGSDGTGGTAGQTTGTGGSASGGSTGSSAQGGSTGSTATGGSPTGGAHATGQGGSTGSPATGGSTASGGAPATGGTTGQGGSPATGGNGPGTGGSTATGGTTASGGATGSTATGGRGVTGTGGSATTGTGGRGSTGTGGNTGTGTGGASASTGGTGGGATTGTGGSVTTGTGGSATTGTGGTGSSTSTAAGTIVPLYTDPSDPSWNAIITAAEAHPTVHVVAIVNPSDGPGSSKSSAYTSGIASLQAAGIKVIGYIATGYGSHSIASMEAEIDTWKSFYPTLQGIFFDEQSNSTSDVAHYQTLSQYAHNAGLGYTVGNPGTDVPAAYIGALDTMLIYESNGVPTVNSLAAWSAYAPSNFGVIPYAVSSMDTTFVQQARKYVAYIYLTNDDLPNPWDSLTSYFSQLLTALE